MERLSNAKAIAKNKIPINLDGRNTTYSGENKAVNRLASAVGRGKTVSLTPDQVKAAHGHTSAPLTALQDPSQFGPPPKNLNYYDETGKPKTASTAAARIGYGPARIQPKPLVRQPLVPSRQMQITQTEEPEEQQLQITQGGESYQPQRPTGSLGPARPPRSQSSTSTAMTRPVPQPPPRLPARQNEYPDEYTPPAPPAYGSIPQQVDEQQEEYLNQAAVSRLGQAGVSVPGFGIGQSAQPTPTQRGGGISSGQLSELQARLARIQSPSQSQPQSQPQSSAPTTASGSGTTWSQKQQAIQTAAAFRKDPSSISFSDARDAASTANNFRERHGQQVAAGWNTAQNTAQKYGVADKVGGMLAAGAGSAQAQRYAPSAAQDGRGFNNLAAAAATKKKPPPPPKKDFLLGQGQQEEDGADGPPPIPMASKPRW